MYRKYKCEIFNCEMGGVVSNTIGESINLKQYKINDIEKIYIEEIKVIQDIIKRMANNSFLLKGWAVTVVVITIALKLDVKNNTQPWLAIIPLIAFWYLDAYYLQQEKLFRELHNWVRENRLFTADNLFDLGTDRFKQKVSSPFCLMWSVSLIGFYGSITVLTTIYLLLNNGLIPAGVKFWLESFCMLG